jgi:hypothetical protein
MKSETILDPYTSLKKVKIDIIIDQNCLFCSSTIVSGVSVWIRTPTFTYSSSTFTTKRITKKKKTKLDLFLIQTSIKVEK